MNRTIPRVGAAIVSLTVFAFALCMIFDFTFGSYLVCMFLPIGYLMTAVGFANESRKDRKVAADLGVVLGAVYAVLILLVYFAQTTSVRLESLGGDAAGILDYRRGGLMFNYDLLGYGMMALSTFFLGLSLAPKTKADRWLKALLIIHGIFFFGCFVMPMTGVFLGMGETGSSKGGTWALLFWCAYFFPVGVLSFFHFKKTK